MRAFKQQVATFSLEGVVDDPEQNEDGALDLSHIEELFSGYEVVDHAHLKLTPILLAEEPADAQAPPSPQGQLPNAGGLS